MNRSVKAALCVGLFGISALSFSPPVAAEECGGSNMAAQILAAHQDKMKALGCKNDKDCIAKRADLINSATTFWNMMAGNSWATIGPRDLAFGQDLKGTVVNPGERRFVTAVPIIDFDNMTLAFNKTDGKAETDVQVSKLDAQGNCVDVARFTVPKGDGSFSKSLTISAVRGSVITVRITPKGLGRKLGYTLRATGQ